MDKGFLARGNWHVVGPVAARKQIAHTLTAAYAGGLLSEDTFVRRVDQLLGTRLIDRFRLIGDLNLRRSARGGSLRLLRALSAVARQVRNRAAGAEYRPVLLGLDWNGGEHEL